MTAALNAPKTPFSSKKATGSPSKRNPDATRAETTLLASDDAGDASPSTPVARGSATPGRSSSGRRSGASADAFVIAPGASQQRVCDECYAYAVSHRTVGRADSFQDDISGGSGAAFFSSGNATGTAGEAGADSTAVSATPMSVAQLTAKIEERVRTRAPAALVADI